MTSTKISQEIQDDFTKEVGTTIEKSTVLSIKTTATVLKENVKNGSGDAHENNDIPQKEIKKVEDEKCATKRSAENQNEEKDENTKKQKTDESEEKEETALISGEARDENGSVKEDKQSKKEE